MYEGNMHRQHGESMAVMVADENNCTDLLLSKSFRTRRAGLARALIHVQTILYNR